MVKPKVKLLQGLHLTATERRCIIETVEFQRTQKPETWGKQWIGYKRSPKSYSALPDPEHPGRYAVAIRTFYTTDAGQRRERLSSAVVQIDGIAPLPAPEYQTQDLFALKPWKTQT